MTLVVLVGVGLWKTSATEDSDRVAVVRHCRGVMGTDASLAVVVPADRTEEAQKWLRDAEAELRRVEARMSTWIAQTEISKLNAADAGQFVRLSTETLDVLRAAKEVHVATDGAFDVTCRPLVELWRRAAERGRAPDDSELAAAREASGWQWIELTDAGAVKRRATARVDLGGIAKGYAVDRAAALLHNAGADGGMVEVGGDLICFGLPVAGLPWSVDVKDPFGDGNLATLEVFETAVCTSGNYARPIEIGSVRHSHIVDPRTGRTADTVASVTVTAPTAQAADVWATALTVLGGAGFDRLPVGVEAMIVTGTAAEHRVAYTPGFRRFLSDAAP